jgi:hypothetical protein
VVRTGSVMRKRGWHQDERVRKRVLCGKKCVEVWRWVSRVRGR